MFRHRQVTSMCTVEEWDSRRLRVRPEAGRCMMRQLELYLFTVVIACIRMNRSQITRLSARQELLMLCCQFNWAMHEKPTPLETQTWTRLEDLFGDSFFWEYKNRYRE